MYKYCTDKNQQKNKSEGIDEPAASKSDTHYIIEY